jgi:sugar O-acyltransferase (sialic acid O-acetyltransferase NeuD family)
MRILILGAGGHAQVIADAILSASRSSQDLALAGFLDDNTAIIGQTWLGAHVLDTFAQVDRYEHDAVVVGIGDNVARARVFDRMRQRGEHIARVIHPRATVAAGVQIGDGTVVFAGAVINTGSIIGPNVIVNSGATVDHHARIGAHVHIAPGVHLGGTVTLGEGVMLGIGSSVILGRTIGEWSLVAAGAVVTRDLPARITAAGVPARAIKSYELAPHT